MVILLVGDTFMDVCKPNHHWIPRTMTTTTVAMAIMTVAMTTTMMTATTAATTMTMTLVTTMMITMTTQQ